MFPRPPSVTSITQLVLVLQDLRSQAECVRACVRECVRESECVCAPAAIAKQDLLTVKVIFGPLKCVEKKAFQTFQWIGNSIVDTVVVQSVPEFALFQDHTLFRAGVMQCPVILRAPVQTPGTGPVRRPYRTPCRAVGLGGLVRACSRDSLSVIRIHGHNSALRYLCNRTASHRRTHPCAPTRLHTRTHTALPS